MVFDILQLKKIRRQVNLTQKEFAQKAGISQSMVAKIEAGRLDPTYSYIKKIEQTINELTKNEELKAEDIMTRRIISVKKDVIVREVINLMTKYKISQIPVIEKNIVLGLITESLILNYNDGDLAVKTVKEVMNESPPVVEKTAQLSVIKSLLQFYPIVLIKGSGKMVGVVTKADVLREII